MANFTVSFKFPPGWPLLPWQRNLGQNRLKIGYKLLI